MSSQEERVYDKLLLQDHKSRVYKKQSSNVEDQKSRPIYHKSCYLNFWRQSQVSNDSDTSWNTHFESTSYSSSEDRIKGWYPLKSIHSTEELLWQFLKEKSTVPRNAEYS